MGEWDKTLDDYLTGAGTATCAALANTSDFKFYAASPSAGDKGWGMLYADDKERPIMQENGKEKKIKINEAATLKDACTRDMGKDGPSPTGLWLGGQKYKVTVRNPDAEAGEGNKVVHVHAGAPNEKGVQILMTKKTVAVAGYDKKAGIAPGACLKALEDTVKWMIEQGL